MSLIGKTIEEQIYNFLTSKGLTPTGACALMANLKAESRFKATNLQDSFNSKLGLTDEEYTEQVDNGKYVNFVHDSAGYGLAQWTFWSRKEKLWNFHKAAQKSIGDTETQLLFLYHELSTTYASILKELQTNKTIRQLSDIVLTQFERPANQSETVKELRASYGYEIFDRVVNTITGPTYSRQAVVDLIRSWEGKKESDGSFKSIIDIYNSYEGKLPRGTKMQYDWAWCACTWSAIAIQLRYTAIMPIEISCAYLIEEAKRMNCWVEDDSYVPDIGDGVLYDWQDNGIGDNTGNPDHVGTVIEVNRTAGYFVVMEGNYSNAVKRRTMSINGKFIRGFITPHYTDDSVAEPPKESGKDIDIVAHEVIAGTWGNNPARKQQLEAAGYDYEAVRARVNEILNGNAMEATGEQPPKQEVIGDVTATEYAQSKNENLAGTYTTTANLYLRNGAGTNKKALLVIPKGHEVKCYGYYSTFNEVRWLYIQTIVDGIIYTGFSHIGYLSRKEITQNEKH